MTGITGHYGQPQLIERIDAGIRAAGKDPAQVVSEDLGPVDQFHTRGTEATLALAAIAELQPEERVLDLGGGIGGGARLLAKRFGARVTVVDLTPEYCEVGEILTRRQGLSERVRFLTGDAVDPPVPPGSFDVVWTQHSTMNIPDKDGLYRAARRSLRPGGRFAMHEIMAGPEQPVYFPVPWAPGPEISFLRPPDEVRASLQRADFRETVWRDVTQETIDWLRTRMAAAAAAGPAPIGLHLLLGDRFPPAFQNIVRNFEENRIRVVEAVLT